MIGTWNLRAFGDLTEKWSSTSTDSPKRDIQSLLYITEIVRRFDVIAIQEVKGNIKCLRHMMKALGDHWSFLLTDVNRGDPGNDERMAFIFDTRRVKGAGLACELVLLPGDGHRLPSEVVDRQFARPPYGASFTCAGQTFILITLHVLYGKKAEDRVPELEKIAQWMANWGHYEHDWGHNLIVLGDFNIDRKDDPLYQAFTSTGLRVPDALHQVPRTIFGSPLDRHYDQIAWFTGDGGVSRLELAYTGTAGTFDFTKVVLRSLERDQVSWRISDHLPLWVEFSTRRD